MRTTASAFSPTDKHNPKLWAPHYHAACHHRYDPTTSPALTTDKDHPAQIAIFITDNDEAGFLITHPRWCAKCAASRAKALESTLSERLESIDEYAFEKDIDQKTLKKLKEYTTLVIAGRIQALSLPLEFCIGAEGEEDEVIEGYEEEENGMDIDEDISDETMSIDEHDDDGENNFDVENLLSEIKDVQRRVQEEKEMDEDELCKIFEDQSVGSAMEDAFQEWFDGQVIEDGMAVQGKLEKEAMDEDDVDLREFLMEEALL